MRETYQVQYAPQAYEDLNAIFSYIARVLQAPQAAKDQTDHIQKAILSLGFMPARHPAVDWEPWASMHVHQCPVDRYKVFYMIDEEAACVTVIRIVYGGRSIKEIVLP